MRRKQYSLEEYVEGIRQGNRVMLGKAITLVESARTDHIDLAAAVLARLNEQGMPAQETIRIAITGVPGVGKSTFIESFGMWLIERGERVAVLAIDPSSAISRGSILGDKTRMEQLSVHENAFVRPSPAGDSLGGVARKTREAILLTEAAGYSVVLVETVGVGQSEIAAHRMCDLFMLLLLPGAGDELQGIKRGIVEMADILVVNKADGDRKKAAAMAQAHYINATHLLPPDASGWSPKVLTSSAVEHAGMEEVWNQIVAYRALTRNNGYWANNRRQQAQYWLHETLSDGIRQLFYAHPEVQAHLPEIEQAVIDGRISPFAAARTLLDFYQKI